MRNYEPDKFADLIMPRDLSELRQLADELGVDIQTECQALYRCNVESLSQCYVNDLRSHLQSLMMMAHVA